MAEIQFLDVCLPDYFQGLGRGNQELVCFEVPSGRVRVEDIRDCLMEQENELPEYVPVTQPEYAAAVERYIESIGLGAEEPVWHANPEDVDDVWDYPQDSEHLPVMYFVLSWEDDA